MEITIVSSKVGFGELGLDGNLGYLNAKVNVENTKGYDTISAHAPSKIEIEINGHGEVFAVQNIGVDASFSTSCMVDGNYIGTIRKQGEKTPVYQLEPGRHTLSFETERNRNARTIWCLKQAQNNHQVIAKDDCDEEDNYEEDNYEEDNYEEDNYEEDNYEEDDYEEFDKTE